MRIFYECSRALQTGEIVILGETFKDDVKYKAGGEKNEAIAGHAETVYCQEKHAHSKDCAKTFLPAVKPAIEAWFASWDATPDDVLVDMPQRQITVSEDGKTRKRTVDDRDLEQVVITPIEEPKMDADPKATMDVPLQ